MASLEREVNLRRAAELAAATARKAAVVGRTGQVARSSLVVGDDDVMVDDIMVGAIDTALTTDGLESDVTYLDEGMSDDLGVILDSGSVVDDLIDVADGVPDLGDTFDQVADADEDAHTAGMNAIGANQAVTEAQAEAAQAAADAADAKTTADGKNSRRRGVTEPDPPESGWVQGDQWVRDEDRDGVLVPVQVLVWDGTGFVPEQIIADDILVFGEDGTVRIADNSVTAGTIAADALDFKTARGAQFYGGYIEAPTIASSSRLGSGANVLTDPEFQSAVNTAWVLGGHAGDAAASQRDTITWDKTWTMPDLYPAVVRTYRNWGSVVADLVLTPAARQTGSIVMANYGWLDKSARTISNPASFPSYSSYQFGAAGGGSSDPTFRAVDFRPPLAGVARTTTLTNSAVTSVVAGERWNIRVGFEQLTDATAGLVTSAKVQIINSGTSAVLWEYSISHRELQAGSINAWWDVPASATVKLRISATYTAGGGGRTTKSPWAGRGQAIRRPTLSSRARKSKDGATISEWVPTSQTSLGYLMAPSEGFTPDDWVGRGHGDAYDLRSRFNWNITHALLAKVEPTKGWRLTEEFGAEFFNELGARTGRLDGEENYFTGRIGGAESGSRFEIEGDVLTAFDEYGTAIGMMRRSGPGVTTSFNTFALKSQLDAWAPIDGTHAWVTAEDREYVRAGGAWKVFFEDTAWTNVPLAAGMTGTLEVKLRNGVVFMRGQPTGSPLTTGAFATLPEPFRPTGSNRIFNTPAAGTTVGKVSVDTNGYVAISVVPSSGNYVIFDPISYLP